MRFKIFTILNFAVLASLLISTATASLTKKGLVCIDKEQLSSEWSSTEDPLISSVAHWFDEKKVSTTTWVRKNDTIKMLTTRNGVPFKTDAKTIRWKTTVGDEDRIISIDRATAERSVLSGKEILVSADCEIFLKEKEFQKKLEAITQTLQTKFNQAIAKHKL